MELQKVFFTVYLILRCLVYMLALAETRAVSQYSGFGTGSSMPLSSQEIFPVVSNFKQLSLSPAHDHPLQPEDMVTDKEPVQQPEEVRL